MAVYIAVIGGANCSEEQYKLSYDTGAEVARRGGIVICGGGSGTMEAAARGACDAGGVAIGILPGGDHREGNHYLSYAIATGIGEARNAIVARTADVLIAIGGEYGTLSEIALALKMGKTVIALHSWKCKAPDAGFDPVVKVLSPVVAVAEAYSCLGLNP